MPQTVEAGREPFAALRARVADELARPAPPAAQALTDAIRERHGDAVAAVVFYGSCLRKRTHEGVLDFYVLVDSYRAVYGLGATALANALLPPNVFYLEAETPDLGVLRTKYAVISTADFERSVGAGALHPYVWARFAQPALIAWARDDVARQRAESAVARATVTLVQRLGVFLPGRGSVQRFSLAALWQEALRRTYGAELRTESPETVRSHYEADPERYDTVGLEALATLEREGWIDELHVRGPAVEVRMPPGRALRARWRWRALRPWAKALAFLRLIKSAFTFGDWLPYALWKLERHTGVRVEPTPRQRRHPLIYGWPVLFRLLRERSLR